VYALVAVALPLHLKKLGKPIVGAIVLAVMSVLAMALVLEGTLYPVPAAPKNLLPYYFLLYLVVAALWNGWCAKRAAATFPG
jgi:hypothetical protein